MTRAPVCLALAAAMLAACSEEPSDPPIDHIEITVGPVRPFYPVNDTVRATAHALDANGNPTPSGIPFWTSLTPSLLVHQEDGLFKAVGQGLATIEVRLDGVTAQVQVLVKGLLHSTHIQTSETWSVADTPHVVQGHLTVGSLSIPGTVAALTIERASRVLFRPNSELLFGDIYPGRLVIPPGISPMRLEGDSAGSATWIGLSFRGPGQSELRNVEFRHCGAALPGGPSQGCIRASSSLQLGPVLLLDDVTITAPAYAGMTLGTFVTLDPGSRNLTITDSDGHIASISPELAGHLPPGSRFERNQDNTIWIGDGLVPDSLTWSDPGAAFRLVGRTDIAGPNQPFLTISPGMHIYADALGEIVTGSNTQSGLVIGAPGGLPVIIESTGSPWAGITLSDGTLPSAFYNLELRNCGGTPPGASPRACVIIDGGSGSGTRLHVENATIRDAAFIGVGLTAQARFASTSTNLTIVGSGDVPVVLPADAIASLPDGDYRFNGVDGIRVGNISALTSSATWPNRSVPYLLPAGLDIGGPNDPVLTLDPGVALEVGGGHRIAVGAGALKALGTAPLPVVFRSATPGTPGSWYGVELTAAADARTRLDYVQIHDAGFPESGLGGSVRLHGDPGGVLRHTTIVNSPTCGVLLFGTSYADDYTNPLYGNSFVNVAGLPTCTFP